MLYVHDMCSKLYNALGTAQVVTTGVRTLLYMFYIYMYTIRERQTNEAPKNLCRYHILKQKYCCNKSYNMCLGKWFKFPSDDSLLNDLVFNCFCATLSPNTVWIFWNFTHNVSMNHDGEYYLVWFKFINIQFLKPDTPI